jgi:16S rRNA (uracil1498-N3)-methyltransferase
VPTVHPVRALPDWLGAHPAEPSDLRLILSTNAQARLRELNPGVHITLMAGPEGGFASEELAMTAACGFTAVRLGPRILRTETAAIAALAAIHALWGDF